MPVRIRMQGDITRSNTQVRNILTGYTNLAQPGGAIALEGLSLKLDDVPNNESFLVTSDTSNFQIGVRNTVLRDAFITPGSYGINDLLAQVEGAANLAGTNQAVDNGQDIQVSLDNGRTSFTMNNYPTEAYDLSLVGSALIGDPEVNDNTIEASGAGFEYLFLYTTPRFQDKVSFFLTSSADVRMYCEETTEIKWGMGVSGGFWGYFDENAVFTVSPTLAVPGAIGSMTHYGLNVHYDMSGVGLDVDLSNLLDNNVMSKDQLLYHILGDVSSGLQDISMNLQYESLPATEVLQFGDGSGNKILANYLGFNTIGPYTSAGNPAVILSDHAPQGNLGYPGVIVNLQNMQLKTYDMAPNSTGKPNMLYVIHGLTDGRFAGAVPAVNPVDLDILREVPMNDLTVTFLDAGSGKPLVFSEDPDLTLLLYSPDETIKGLNKNLRELIRISMERSSI